MILEMHRIFCLGWFNLRCFLVFQEPLNKPPDEGSAPEKHSVAELESPASSKQADQPSPVSVLETPFPDDLSSSSECFESLSADLQGIWKASYPDLPFSKICG